MGFGGSRIITTQARVCKLPLAIHVRARLLPFQSRRVSAPQIWDGCTDGRQAPCPVFFYRNSANGAKRLIYAEIAGFVRNQDGARPTEGGVRQCVMKFHEPKAKRGRKSGYRKTSKAEDKVVLQTFRKLLPPGHGVDSRKVHMSLPKKLRDKLSRRTLIRRLAEQRYVPTRKSPEDGPKPLGRGSTSV